MKALILPAARRDILDQVHYYGEQGRSDVAMRFLDAVRLSVDALTRMPDAGSPKRFDNPKLAGLRSWSVADFDAFKIYYLVDSSKITVVRILHGRRDVDRVLEAGNENGDLSS